MDAIQTDITDQTGMLPATPMSSNPILNAGGTPGSDERDNNDSGNGTNTGIENQRYSFLEQAGMAETIPKSARRRKCVYNTG